MNVLDSKRGTGAGRSDRPMKEVEMSAARFDADINASKNSIGLSKFTDDAIHYEYNSNDMSKATKHEMRNVGTSEFSMKDPSRLPSKLNNKVSPDG